MKTTDTSLGTHNQLQLMMSSDFVVFRAGVALVLMCSFYKSTEDPLPELSPQQYFSTLQPGKASLAYFCQVGKYILQFLLVSCDNSFHFHHYTQWELWSVAIV